MQDTEHMEPGINIVTAIAKDINMDIITDTAMAIRMQTDVIICIQASMYTVMILKQTNYSQENKFLKGSKNYVKRN